MLNNWILEILCSLFIGVVIAAAYTYKTKFTKSFVVTLAMLPAIVCMVIMMVNGNVGAGVAVAGAFSLVRFRSIPGTAKEIGHIFLAMAAGLVAGMGCLEYAAVFTAIMCSVSLLFTFVCSKTNKNNNVEKTLRITIPEDLNYENLFDEVFEAYAKNAQVVSVKTTNMGSLFKLTYRITMKEDAKEKEFIDALRCRNGNLEISMMMQEDNANEL